MTATTVPKVQTVSVDESAKAAAVQKNRKYWQDIQEYRNTGKWSRSEGSETKKISLDGNPQRKRFTCNFSNCNKVFERLSHLNAHLKTHTNKRPFICGRSACGESFKRSDHLKRHWKTQH